MTTTMVMAFSVLRPTVLLLAQPGRPGLARRQLVRSTAIWLLVQSRGPHRTTPPLPVRRLHLCSLHFRPSPVHRRLSIYHPRSLAREFDPPHPVAPSIAIQTVTHPSLGVYPATKTHSRHRDSPPFVHVFRGLRTEATTVVPLMPETPPPLVIPPLPVSAEHDRGSRLRQCWTLSERLPELFLGQSHEMDA